VENDMNDKGILDNKLKQCKKSSTYFESNENLDSEILDKYLNNEYKLNEQDD